MIRPLRPAGFWRRGAALGADALWLFCVSGALTWLLFGTPLSAGAGLASGLIHDLLPAVVFVAGWRWFGMTPGKLLLELRVVDVRGGGHPTLMRSILRYLGYFISALPLGLGFLWAVFDRRNEAWHDKLARTRVMVVEEAVLPERVA